MISAEDRAGLVRVFEEARARGWVGGRGVDDHIEHSLGFAAVASAVPTVAVDLGSGGGVPGLVLAAVWPESQWTLVDSSLPRAAFLELHCARLGWSNRVTVRHTTAQSLAEDKDYHAQADLVTARSFAKFPDLIQAAAPLLRPGGHLVVSASPNAPPWPTNLLATHNMTPDHPTPTPPKFHHTTRLAP